MGSPKQRLDPESLPPEIQAVLKRPDLLHAELARRELDDFGPLMMGYAPARHHKFVNEKLMAVERGEIKRLLIFAPPGHAKSSWGSMLFPAFYLGKHPKDNIILCTHTQQFSESWGRKIRNLLEVDEWPFRIKKGHDCDVTLSPDSQAAGMWHTNHGGSFFGIGVGGAVTGRRANGIIIDDPIKGREDADSQSNRDKLWDWWRAEMHTRLLPGAWIVGYWTRWHEDDPAGRILPEDYKGGSGVFEGRDGEAWEVVSLPALAEENDILGRKIGEPLWPEMFSDVALEAEKAVQTADGNERNWTALYQQRPSPETGDYFKREWLNFYEEAPKTESLRIYGASDYAVTKGGGDYTVHGVCGVDDNDDMYILDWWRGQVDPFEAVNQWGHMVKTWRPIQWAEDKAQIEKTLGPFLDKRARELKAYIHREQFSVWRQDKEARAQAIRGRASQGKLYFPMRARWITDLTAELLMFPNGKHDDQVDVLSLMGRMLTGMRGPQRNRRPRQTKTSTSMRYLRR